MSYLIVTNHNHNKFSLARGQRSWRLKACCHCESIHCLLPHHQWIQTLAHVHHCELNTSSPLTIWGPFSCCSICCARRETGPDRCYIETLAIYKTVHSRHFLRFYWSKTRNGLTINSRRLPMFSISVQSSHEYRLLSQSTPLMCSVHSQYEASPLVQLM